MIAGLLDDSAMLGIISVALGIGCIIAVMSWIGNQKNARNERKKSLRLEAILQAIPWAMVVADGDLRDIRVNDAAAALLGVPAGENLIDSGPPAPWRLLHQKEPIPQEQFPLSRALRGEEVLDQEIELAFPDGRRLSLAASARAIRDQEGRVTGAVCALKDRSEASRLGREIGLGRRQVEEAGIQKDWRLAISFHDIRSSLNTLTLLAEILDQMAAKPLDQGEELVKLAADLKTATTSLAKLVMGTLDLARSSSDRPPLEESELPLGDLLAEECRHHLPLAREKGLSLIIEPPDPRLWIRSDLPRMAHALGFLVHHSLKNTPAGSVTARAVVNAEGRPEIQVIDTGGGLPSEVERQLLDHLSRIRRDAPVQEGPGLAVGKKLAEAVEGRLTIDNRPGQGTTYKITFPAESLVSPPPAPRGGGAKEPPPAGSASPTWWL